MSMGDREISSLSDQEIMDLAREVESHDFDRIAPPPQVWNNILAELEVERAEEEATARRASSSAQSAPWFKPARLLSIAAATLLMVGVAVAVVSTRADDTSVTEVAAAMLTDEGLPVATAETADATVFCEDDACYVEVRLTALPEAGSDDLELWVINGDVSDMHSLGIVTSTEGRFELPPDATAEGFPIVDISIEPNDGDPTHSGQSVLRGVLDQP